MVVSFFPLLVLPFELVIGMLEQGAASLDVVEVGAERLKLIILMTHEA